MRVNGPAGPWTIDTVRWISGPPGNCSGCDARPVIACFNTLMMSDIRSVMTSLHELREEGFSVAVDDFGTGYSSLRYLQEFPVDALKIDSSFVQDIERNSDSRAICIAIIALAQRLGLMVVGEGVEDPWQLEFLKREGCDTVQGHLLGEALSAREFTSRLAAGTSHFRSAASDRVVRFTGQKMTGVR